MTDTFLRPSVDTQPYTAGALLNIQMLSYIHSGHELMSWYQGIFLPTFDNLNLFDQYIYKRIHRFSFEILYSILVNNIFPPEIIGTS